MHISDLDSQRSFKTNDFELGSPDVDYLTANPPYGSSATFVLPSGADSDLLYLLSRGSLSHGSIKVDAVESSSDDVRVNVEARYWSRKALQRAVVCKLEKDDGDARGVGIFTPRSSRGLGPLDYIRFNIHVQIPVSASKTPRVVKAFKTALANFRHEFGDTVDKLRFEALTLEATNAAVTVKVRMSFTHLHPFGQGLMSEIIYQSVFAHVGVVRTSNGLIEGSFNSSQRMKIETTNAHVDALVNLSNNSTGLRRNTFLEIFSWDGCVHLIGCSTYMTLTHTSSLIIALSQAQ